MPGTSARRPSLAALLAGGAPELGVRGGGGGDASFSFQEPWAAALQLPLRPACGRKRALANASAFFGRGADVATVFNAHTHADPAGGNAKTPGGQEVQGTGGGYNGLDETPQTVLTYVSAPPESKQVDLSGDSVQDCINSCERSPQLGGVPHIGNGDSEAPGSPQERAVVSEPPKLVEDCIRYCKTELKGLPLCFPGDATVVVRDRGRVALADLDIGAEVLCVDPVAASPSLRFEAVRCWLHREPDRTEDMLVIKHELGEICLSREHLIFVQKGGSDGRFAPWLAREVAVGDRLWSPWVDGTLAAPRVMAVAVAAAPLRRGLFAPWVATGALVVDGAVASCYALPLDLEAEPIARRLAALVGGPHRGAHLLHMPLRLAAASTSALAALRGSADRSRCCLPASASAKEEDARKGETQQDAVGIHPYSGALYALATSVLVAA